MPPSWPPTRSTARSGAAARDGAPALAPSPDRTLVAMSGGVDSAVAARLALDAGHEVVAVTLELWADPANDGERSCCSPQAVTGARALAHRMGLPHVTLDLREPFRSGGGGRLRVRARGGPHSQPVRPLQRPGALRRDAGAGRPRSARPVWPPGTTPASTTTATGRCCAPRADPLKDQTYMLARLDADQLARLWFPLGRAGEAPRAGAGARRRAVRGREAARARTSASWPAPGAQTS